MTQLLPPPVELKLCIKCKFHHRQFEPSRAQVCRHPNNVRGFSPVDGLPILYIPSCEDQRAKETARETKCGAEARWFESIEIFNTVQKTDTAPILARLRNIKAEDL